jgi:aspartate racemase
VGIVNDASREAYRAVIAKLVDRGAEGILLGCTEIARLIRAGDVDVDVFDTTIIHAHRPVELTRLTSLGSVLLFALRNQ